MTKASFRAVTLEVRQKIQAGEKVLQDLGQSREGSIEQRIYLTRIASSFHTMAAKAIDGHYMRDACFKNAEFRLATIIMKLNDQFSQQMFDHGCNWRFDYNDSQDSDRGKIGEKVNDNQHSTYLQMEFIPEGYSELLHIISVEPAPPGEHGSLMDYISDMYENTKVFEVGTVNPSLLPMLFEEQTRLWPFIALRNVAKTIQQVHQFVLELLKHTCSDSCIFQSIWSRIVPQLLEGYKKAMNQAKVLVELERNGRMITMNHYFADSVKARRDSRTRQRLMKMQSWTTEDEKKEPLLRLEDSVKAFISNGDHSVQDIHDHLAAYYKVARKRFVDNVCLQAINYCLISAPSGPLELFSPEFSSRLSEADLAEIAGETTERIETRSQLTAELSSLRRVLSVLEGQ